MIIDCWKYVGIFLLEFFSHTIFTLKKKSFISKLDIYYAKSMNPKTVVKDQNMQQNFFFFFFSNVILYRLQYGMVKEVQMPI